MITQGPGIMKLFGLIITQNQDLSYTIHGDEKVMDLESFPISRIRRCRHHSILYDFEKSVFMSVYRSLWCLGVAGLPFCVLIVSHFQQKLPDLSINSIISESKYLRLMKSYGTYIHSPIPRNLVITQYQS